MSVPFVGRRDELDALAALLRRIEQGRAPGIALITGEPGSGKSRLLAEFLARSPSPGTRIRIVGFEPIQPIPLAAVGELLRQLASVPGHGARLEELTFGGHDAPQRDPLRIFEAAHRALASFGPLLLVIDDLQWMDEQSVALVHYLLRAAEPAGNRLVVIAAARASPPAAALRSTAEAEVPSERRVFIELGPLSLEDGLSLARAINRGLDETGAADLWRRARGSPFWLEALAPAAGADDAKSVIRERLASLSSDAGFLLAALAVGARPFASDEVARILGWEVARADEAVHELVGRGLALELAGSIRLAHDLIRETATRDVPDASRRGLHARLAEYIESGAGDDLQLLHEALQHRAAAGLPTADLALRLLSSPQRRLLGRGAIELMASISDALPPGANEQLRIDRGLGELAAVLGDQELAMGRWRQVAERSGDPSERQHASVEAARAAYRLRRSDEAHADLEQARAAGRLSAEVDVDLLALQAEIELWLDHRTSAGSATAQCALAAAQDLVAEAGGLEQLTPASRRACLAAYEVSIDAALQQDRADEVMRLSDASLLVAEGLDDESRVASLIRPAFGLRPLGRARESEDRYRRAWLLASRLILPLGMVEAGHGLSRVLRDLGSLSEARTIAAETVQLEARLGHPPRRWGNAQSILHSIELALGDSTAFDRLRADARTEPDPHYRLAIHQLIAAWRARFGGMRSMAEVVAELDAARAAAALAACPRCSGELSVISAELLARVGQLEDATRELTAWEAGGTSDELMRTIWGTRARAAISFATGDDAAAVSALEGLIRELERVGLLGDLLWARLDLGRALGRIDRARSVEAYTEAAELAEQIGAVSQGRLAIQELRRLGVRAWRRGRASSGDGIASLSDREAEVARLVADGGTNREIGEALLVSPRTVERHITNVLAKLGLRNRTELAALVRSSSVRGSPDD